MVYLALIVWLNIALHSMDIIVQIFLFRTYKELIAGPAMLQHAQLQMLLSAINQ